MAIDRARSQRLFLAVACLVLGATVGPVLRVGATNSVEEKLWQHRNLGKAFYENPATQYEAVSELRKALELAPSSAIERVNYGLSLLRAGQEAEGIVELEKAQKQDPSIPHTWFNLGIAYKKASRYDDARRQLEGMIARVPDDAIAHYNLGILFKLDGNLEKALFHLQRAARLDPTLAGPHFQLATAYRQAKRPEDTRRAMQRFREIKAKKGDTTEDLEWSFYSELAEARLPEHAKAVGKVVSLRLGAVEVSGGFDPGSSGLVILDLDGDGGRDLIAWSKAGIKAFRDAATKAQVGLGNLEGILDIAPADFDNDGLTDLAVVQKSGPKLWVNTGGRFRASPTEMPKGSFRRVLWLDDDHDYDLDLFLLGRSSARLRNRGAAGFSDETSGFPFAAGNATDAVVFDLLADTQGFDLAVVYSDRPAVLYRDRLGGRYERQELGAELPAARRIIAHDYDHDSWTDLIAAGERGLVLLHNQQAGGLHHRKLVAVAGPEVTTSALGFADLENRGVSDLLTTAGVHRNQGLGRFAAVGSDLEGTSAVASADFDGDGRIDLATIDGRGSLKVWRNTTEGGGWLEVRLEGVKNTLLAQGAEIEVKAGTRYQKKSYQGTAVHFGLGDASRADTVRITWPNGMIQNEARQPGNRAFVYKEAQRLSGSCPMVFTWNGKGFEFITDVLGVAPLGAAAGDGEYFPVDHDEYIWIPGSSLVPRNDRYEIRITEELREIAYLDEIRLIPVDHPEDEEIFHNDKFKGPPFPDFRLFAADERIYPVAARDQLRREVRDRLLAADGAYVDGFRRNYSGIGEMHTLELDFAPTTDAASAVLILSGWVDWADGSTFLGLAQERGDGLVMPYLQVRTHEGGWQTVIEDMGIPAGKPKTIAVDLSEAWSKGGRQFRIVTNLCLYWDEVFLIDALTPSVRLDPLQAQEAKLRFRGFSRAVVHEKRLQPERFVYADLRATSMWNPTPGRYTRYGEVRSLLWATDDRMVIMGSGDELALSFDATALPPLKPGWRRDFLLFVDGWAKDGDANTAHSQTVEPLPYHRMPQYPYAEPDSFPDGEPYRRYRRDFNSRPALRLIRPLAERRALER